MLTAARKFMAALKEKLATIAPTLCADCQRRATTNPLRVLDCKVPEDQAIIDTLPSILDHLCEECHAHFHVVQEHLRQRGIPFEVRPRLVRGLDYYMRTTFEITHGALGAQNSVLGGGRYDGLAESLGSKVPAPGIGFSIGEDRLVMSVEEAHRSQSPASTCFSRRWATPRSSMPERWRRNCAARGSRSSARSTAS